MRAIAVSLLLALLAACAQPIAVPRQPPAPPTGQPSAALDSPQLRAFAEVVDRVMPIAVDVCRRRARAARCDFLVAVDDSPDIEPNAFQTLGPGGRPVVGFTLPLIWLARNPDELAFILAHESAHHIAGHIPRGQASARLGAQLIGGLVAAQGGDDVAIREAQGFGAFLGARRFAKEFELEADALGALIARRAGYDPLRGVMFFQDAPDPGNRFLGTHPPNADRIDVVRRVLLGQ